MDEDQSVARNFFVCDHALAVGHVSKSSNGLALHQSIESCESIRHHESRRYSTSVEED